MAPKETENNAYAKFWGDKQRALWKDRTRIGENAFKYSPARSWNELPTDYRFQRSTVD